jgi:hypothetical protein
VQRTSFVEAVLPLHVEMPRIENINVAHGAQKNWTVATLRPSDLRTRPMAPDARDTMQGGRILARANGKGLFRVGFDCSFEDRLPDKERNSLSH